MLVAGVLAAVAGVVVALLSGWVIAIVVFPLAAVGLLDKLSAQLGH